jgi:hypothetical protein
MKTHKKSLIFFYVLSLAAMLPSAERKPVNSKFFRDDPAKYWDVPALMETPRFRPNPFPDSDAPGMKSFLVAGRLG